MTDASDLVQDNRISGHDNRILAVEAKVNIALGLIATHLGLFVTNHLGLW